MHFNALRTRLLQSFARASYSPSSHRPPRIHARGIFRACAPSTFVFYFTRPHDPAEKRIIFHEWVSSLYNGAKDAILRYVINLGLKASEALQLDCEGAEPPGEHKFRGNELVRAEEIRGESGMRRVARVFDVPGDALSTVELS